MTTGIALPPPLRDDCAERYSASRVKWAKRWDDGLGLRRKALLRQLSLRPDIGYKDLWPDEEERRIAARCMSICKEMLGLPNERLVPDDPLEMLVAADGDGGDNFLDFIRALEYEFRLDLIDVIEKPTALGDLVHYIREHQGSLTLAEASKKHGLGCGSATYLWIVFVTVIAWTVSYIVEVVEDVPKGIVGWKSIIALVVSLIMSGVGIITAFFLVVDWFKERKAIREEREKAAKKSSNGCC